MKTGERVCSDGAVRAGFPEEVSPKCKPKAEKEPSLGRAGHGEGSPGRSPGSCRDPPTPPPGGKQLVCLKSREELDGKGQRCKGQAQEVRLESGVRTVVRALLNLKCRSSHWALFCREVTATGPICIFTRSLGGGGHTGGRESPRGWCDVKALRLRSHRTWV